MDGPTDPDSTFGVEQQLRQLTERVAALEAALHAAAPQPTSVAAATEAATPGPTFLPAAPPLSGPTGMQPPPPVAHQQPPPVSTQPPPPTGMPLGTAAHGDHQQQGVPAQRPPAAFEWGIETLLRWAGVVLVTLAGIFLVSTAISRGWIGPELQLLGAAVGGLILLALALHFSDSRRPWAHALGCGGAVVLAASALATHEWLDLVGPGVALALVAGATVISVAVALRTRFEGIALVAGLVGTFASLETLSAYGEGAVLTWVAASIVASSALGLANRWPGVRLIIGWLGALVLMAYSLSEDVDGALQVLGIIGAIIVGLTLWLGPTAAHRLSPTEGPGSWGSLNWLGLDYRLVGFVPAWAWLTAVGLIASNNVEEWQVGLTAIGIAAGFGAITLGTWSKIPRLVSASTLFGALTLLAIGFAVWFNAPTLMVALAGQAIGSYYLSHKLNDKILMANAAIVGVASTGLAVVEMLNALDRDGFDNVGAAVATLLVVLCWAGTAAAIHLRDDLEMPFEFPFVGAWIGTMLWLAAVLTGAPQGLMLISAAWAVMACVGLVLGLTRRQAIIKNVALATLALTLFKLVSVDMAEVDVFWRVGLFFVVGTALIVLGLKIPSLVSPSPPGEAADPSTPGGPTAGGELSTF